MLDIQNCKKIVEKTVGGDVECLGKTRGGVSSLVYEFRKHNGERFFFKQGNDNYKIQAELGEKFRQLNLNYPEIILANEKYIIEKGVEGKCLSEISDRKIKEKVYQQFGEYLSEIHKIKTEGWGPMISLSCGKFRSYKEYYQYLTPFVDKKIFDTVLSVIDKTDDPCLNHGDTGDTHIFTDRNNNFLTLIDFDDILSAPRLYDLTEFYGGLDNDQKMWTAMAWGYFGNIEEILKTDVDFLVNQYLIFLDSWLWYKKENRPELKVRMENDERKTNSLVQKIEEAVSKLE